MTFVQDGFTTLSADFCAGWIYIFVLGCCERYFRYQLSKHRGKITNGASGHILSLYIHQYFTHFFLLHISIYYIFQFYYIFVYITYFVATYFCFTYFHIHSPVLYSLCSTFPRTALLSLLCMPY